MRTLRILLALAFALIGTTSAFAQASFSVLDGGGVSRTFKSVSCGGQICSITILTDSTGAPIFGTAGAANANVISVQGIASGVPLSVALSGSTNNINNISGTVSLPTGASTSANQTSQITQETAINTVLGLQADAAWASGSGTVVAILKSVSTKLGAGINANGQQLMSASSPVVIASDQSALPVPKATATGGAAASDTLIQNSTPCILVKNTPATLYDAQLYTISASPVWVKIYDSATLPTAGAGTIVKTLLIPSASTAANGAGNNPVFGPAGFLLANGLAYCVVTGILNNSSTAPADNTFVVNLGYK